MATPSDIIGRITSKPASPALKGFIEITVYQERLLIAVSTILSVSDRGPQGCTLTLASDIIHNSETLHPILHLKETYEDIIALLVKAQ
jgi:hypothetical protein